MLVTSGRDRDVEIKERICPCFAAINLSLVFCEVDKNMSPFRPLLLFMPLWSHNCYAFSFSGKLDENQNNFLPPSPRDLFNFCKGFLSFAGEFRAPNRETLRVANFGKARCDDDKTAL